jgi:hypothetical protein
MNKVFLLLATIIISCLCIAATASAQSRQMYSWTDDNGVVHFTDERPVGQEVTVHDIPDSEPAAAASPTLPTDEANEPSLAQQRRDEIAQRRQENREQAAVIEAECAAKRAEVERLEPHRRVFFTNEEGETERMDDVERTNQVAEARAFIEANCKDH